MIVHRWSAIALHCCTRRARHSLATPLLLLWLVAAAAPWSPGCGRRGGDGPANASVRTATSGAAPPPTPAPTPAPASPDIRPANPAAAPSAGSSTENSSLVHGSGADAPSPQPLLVEEREKDPAAREVTIKVIVEPPRRAQVWWGAKNLGLAPVELKRPRGSGPVDLIVRTPGYLTFHTRAFTDRDDKITVRLVAEADAPRMHGFRAQ